MPRLYRPTGMRKYRPFGGPGGELLSVAGGGGGAGFTEDFESYTAGELTAQSTWSAGRGNSTATVVAGNYCSEVVNADGLCSHHWDDLGSTYVDGLIQGNVRISSSGHANCQPGFMARYVDADNLIYCALNNGFNELYIISLTGGVQSKSSAAAVWTRGVTYYVDFEFVGTALTCTVYSDAERTTQIKQVTHTSTHNSAGAMGIGNNAQATGQGDFDDLVFSNLSV